MRPLGASSPVAAASRENPAAPPAAQRTPMGRSRRVGAKGRWRLMRWLHRRLEHRSVRATSPVAAPRRNHRVSRKPAAPLAPAGRPNADVAQHGRRHRRADG